MLNFFTKANKRKLSNERLHRSTEATRTEANPDMTSLHERVLYHPKETNQNK